MKHINTFSAKNILLIICTVVGLLLAVQSFSQCPQYTITAPGTWIENTCGDSNNCGNFQIDHVYEVTIPSAGNWKFSLCGSSFDTWIYLYDGSCCGNLIADNDDFCAFQSEVTVNITTGTYYVVADGSVISPYCGDYTLNISLSVGIGANEKNIIQEELQIHPNPATSTFTISGNYKLPAVIELYDLMGRKVKTQIITASSQQVDVSVFPKGMYLWQLGAARGMLMVE